MLILLRNEEQPLTARREEDTTDNLTGNQTHFSKLLYQGKSSVSKSQNAVCILFPFRTQKAMMRQS
jgi:hypothetical protein